MERQVTYILSSGVKILISEIDYQFVLESRLTWYLNNWGYVFCRNKNKEYLHILIAQRMGLNTDNIIDHINRNTLHNNRENLRESNKSLNCLNSKIRNDNISGTTGVYFDKLAGKYHAQIGINSKTINLGRFEKKEDAIKVRLIAEKEQYDKTTSNKDT